MRVIKTENRGLIKHWTNGVDFAKNAVAQCSKIADLPFIHKHVAVMPDVHLGKGATVGSVIATKDAIIPAAVGVDIGCGMQAVRTDLKAEELPDNLAPLRSSIEELIPHGRGKFSAENVPHLSELRWAEFASAYTSLGIETRTNPLYQLGTLGGGNHFVEVCIDLEGFVWVMLHSGSRGIGNMIGRHYIEKAKEDMRRFFINLPDEDLAYIPEGSELFSKYVMALKWAQSYAGANREIMMSRALGALGQKTRIFDVQGHAISCHHNYVAKENHFNANVWVTRKGAVRAREGDLGIIPGSMGARSFIVRGLGNRDSFCSCSHGAGRVMSRTQAKNQVNMKTHLAAIEGVECRKDEGVLDETPSAYKDIDAVLAAQSDLVSIEHELKQVLCVKG